MKICAISDLHGYLPILPESDLLLIGGDIFPNNMINAPYKAMNWFKGEFLEWCKNQDTWEIVLIAGTRDWPIQIKEKSFKKAMKEFGDWFHYLDNEYKELTIEGEKVSIFGTPYSIDRGYWAFTKTDEELNELFSNCPDKVDIILSHDAPYGLTDIPFERLLYMNQNEDIHQGSKPLRQLLNRTDFKYSFHGNLHSSQKELTLFTGGYVTNISYVNEEYKPYENYEPILVNFK